MTTDAATPSSVRSEQVAALVEAARGGDRDAFADLYRMRFGAILRYVGGLLRPGDPVEDAVAEAFIEAWRDLPKLREPRAFDAWLYRIAHRRALAHAARRSTAVDLDAVAEVADERAGAAPDAAVAAADHRALVRDALLRLPDEQREVLVLRHFQGLSHREIGAALGKSAEAVRAQHYRAARELRGHLAALGWPDA